MPIGNSLKLESRTKPTIGLDNQQCTNGDNAQNRIYITCDIVSFSKSDCHRVTENTENLDIKQLCVLRDSVASYYLFKLK